MKRSISPRSLPSRHHKLKEIKWVVLASEKCRGSIVCIPGRGVENAKWGIVAREMSTGLPFSTRIGLERVNRYTKAATEGVVACTRGKPTADNRASHPAHPCPISQPGV